LRIKDQLSNNEDDLIDGIGFVPCLNVDIDSITTFILVKISVAIIIRYM